MLNKIYEKIKSFTKENYKFIIAIIFILLMFYLELPYVIYKSGGTIELSDRVETELTYESKGSFSMSYVTVVKGTPAFILLSFIMPDWDLESIDEEINYNEMIEVGKVYLDAGIDNAIIAAFNETDYQITINKTFNEVYSIMDGFDNDFKVGDEIIAIDDHEITSLTEFKEYINKNYQEDDEVKVKVINDSKEFIRTAKLKMFEDELKVGISIKTRYDYNTEIPIKVKVGENESGSSGGLMTALQIYDNLTEEDLTKGLTIIGTGTIDSDGNVGAIDGVKYKMLAADKKKADIFFVPTENYKEALKVKKEKNLDMEVVEAKTLKDAITYLKNK